MRIHWGTLWRILVKIPNIYFFSPRSTWGYYFRRTLHGEISFSAMQIGISTVSFAIPISWRYPYWITRKLYAPFAGLAPSISPLSDLRSLYPPSLLVAPWITVFYFVRTFFTRFFFLTAAVGAIDRKNLWAKDEENLTKRDGYLYKLGGQCERNFFRSLEYF